MLHNFTIKNNKLFIGDVSAESLIEKYGSPLYVYDGEIIKRQYKAFVDNITYPQLKVHYTPKTNNNPEILKLLRKEGASVEVVSKGGVIGSLNAGYKASEIIYTCSNINTEELKFLIDNNIIINLDSLIQVKKYGELNPGGKMSIRINQGIGGGGHKHTITGGPDSKFGIDITQLEEVQKLVKKYNLQMIGIHQHIGSNSLDEQILIKAIKKLLETAKGFDDLSFLNFGGGFGIAYRPEEKPLNMEKLGKSITKEVTQFVKEYKKEIEIKFEVGRFIVAESGFFLATVVDIKRNPSKTFVGLDAGMNQLVRPAMYDSYHKIMNASSVVGKEEIVSVVGDICESADFFARDRKIAKFKEGDIAAILDAGAYGYCMASFYNERPLPAEVLIEEKKARLIRKQIYLNDFNVTAKKKLL